MNRMYLAVALSAALPLFGQDTMHEGNTGGEGGSVTIFTKSHVHIDRELLKGLGINDNDTDTNGKKKLPPLTEIWRHGHPGNRVLRVLQPGWNQRFRRGDLDGATIDTADWVEITVVNSAGVDLGTLWLNREDRPEAGLLTSGHAAFVDKYGGLKVPIDLRACFKSCPVCSPSAGPPEVSAPCRETKSAIRNVLEVSRPDGKLLGKSDTVWIYSVDVASGQTLGWVAKSPDAEGIRDIIAAKLPSPIKFDFSLTNNGDIQNIAMKELRVRRGAKNGPVVFSAPMPKRASFEVCSIDESTGASACDPLPECQTFWRRHFNKGCRLYGGLGVFTGRGKHESKEHHHH